MRYATKVSFALGMIALVGWLFIPHQINVWTCSQTGSRKGNEIWGDFLVTNQYTQISPLEQRMRDENISFTRDWIQTCGTRDTGFSRLHSHERAPAVYSFRYDLQATFVNHATREEVLQLCTILQSKNISKEQKEEAVMKACNRALDYWEKEISQTKYMRKK